MPRLTGARGTFADVKGALRRQRAEQRTMRKAQVAHAEFMTQDARRRGTQGTQYEPPVAPETPDAYSANYPPPGKDEDEE